MDWFVIVGLIIFLVISMLSGIRLAFAMALVGILFLYLAAGTSAFGDLGYSAWNAMNNFVIVAIPLFLLMGNIIMYSGIADKAYTDLTSWIYFIPGRLLVSNIAACGVFAAISGSSLSTMVTIGNVAIPLQEARGYESRYVCGTIAAGGTLGILIPPSINMVLYGSITETSVAKLFIGGVIPGVICSLLFISFIVLYSTLRKNMAPPSTESYTWQDRVYALKSLIPVGGLIGVVMGGIYTGFSTPTEAAGIGVLGAFLITLAYRRLSWAVLKDSFVATIEATCWCLFLMVGANILGFGLSRAQIPQQIAYTVSMLGLNPIIIITVLSAMYLGLGCIVDPISMMFLTMPVVYPILQSIGCDLVWFGVLLVLLMETGLITPPIGLNLFVVKGLTGTSIKEIILGVIPFVVILMIMIALLIAFPTLATWLPSRMGL